MNAATTARITSQFILAGEAIFTIQEPDGSHHTCKIEHVPAGDRWPDAYFVKLLTGSNNQRDYSYFGKLDKFTGQVRTTAKSARFAGSRALLLLNRVLARIWSDDHVAFERHGYRVHHEGYCGRCGKLLTVPTSVASGYGPECTRIMAGTSASAPEHHYA